MDNNTTPSDVTDQAATTANSAIRSTQSATNQAFDRLSDTVDSARDQAGPLLNRLSAQAQAAATKSADVLRDTSAQLREKALNVQDQTVGYIKDEPVKSMLIAAATGAALMALISLSTRARD